MWFFGDVDIPNHYNKTDINSILANSNLSDLSNYYNKAEIDAIVSNINVSNNHYTKAEIYDIGNELSALVLNTWTKTEVDILLYTNYPSLSFIAENLYAKAELDSTLSAYTTSTQLHTVFLIAKLNWALYWIPIQQQLNYIMIIFIAKVILTRHF